MHFRSIVPRESRGYSTTVPLFGALTATHLTAMLHDALPEKTWVYEIDRAAGLVRYDALDSTFQVDLPLDPMHGTVGVAPALGEVRSSLAPGDWGGNMDTPEMRAGTTCYLGVNVEGALFSLGDGHARQGEGETCGVAVECAMDTVFVVDVVKGAAPTAWPRLEDDEFIMTTVSARPLEDAFRIAHAELVRWVSELTALSLMDAYQLVSQIVLTRWRTSSTRATRSSPSWPSAIFRASPSWTAPTPGWRRRRPVRAGSAAARPRRRAGRTPPSPRRAAPRRLRPATPAPRGAGHAPAAAASARTG